MIKLMYMKTHVLVVFGGQSSEHEVSISGAKNVVHELSLKTYDVSLCYVDLEGKWWLVPEVTAAPKLHRQLLPVLGLSQFQVKGTSDVLEISVILPILHGKNGEDGSVQGLAQLLHTPIVGPDVIAASITMDKDITKQLVRSAGVKTADWMTWYTNEIRPQYERVTLTLGHELFIKPASAGSSIGVSKIHNKIEFDKALDIAAQHDHKVLIESAIKARELEVAVFGTSEHHAAGPGEIRSGAEFYDYDDKYAEGSSAQVIIPAVLEDGQAAEIRTEAMKVYSACQGKGMARVDFLLAPDGQLYLLEINSIPGFTNISMYPKLWARAGLSYSQLLDRLIQVALE